MLYHSLAVCLQGLGGLVEGLSTYINARQLGLQVYEIPEQQANATAPAQPVINNDLVTVTPVLLHVASQPQVRVLVHN